MYDAFYCVRRSCMYLALYMFHLQPCSTGVGLAIGLCALKPAASCRSATTREAGLPWWLQATREQGQQTLISIEDSFVCNIMHVFHISLTLCLLQCMGSFFVYRPVRETWSSCGGCQKFGGRPGPWSCIFVFQFSCST